MIVAFRDWLIEESRMHPEGLDTASARPAIDTAPTSRT